MKEENSPTVNSNDNSDNSLFENPNQDLEKEYSKWVDNQGDVVKNVFGFNSSAELVNGRAAMIGFLMLRIISVTADLTSDLRKFN